MYVVPASSTQSGKIFFSLQSEESRKLWMFPLRSCCWHNFSFNTTVTNSGSWLSTPKVGSVTSRGTTFYHKMTFLNIPKWFLYVWKGCFSRKQDYACRLGPPNTLWKWIQVYSRGIGVTIRYSVKIWTCGLVCKYPDGQTSWYGSFD